MVSDPDERNKCPESLWQTSSSAGEGRTCKAPPGLCEALMTGKPLPESLSREESKNYGADSTCGYSEKDGIENDPRPKYKLVKIPVKFLKKLGFPV